MSAKTDHAGDYAAAMPDAVEIYDTTLRDGSQLEGISLTVDNKLRIARRLDYLGVDYIEGGWPGSNPKDDEFFAQAQTDLDLETSTLVAFGSTRRPNGKAESDPTLANLVGANCSVVCIVGKTWDYHVAEALRVPLEEGIAMVSESVAYLREQGMRVFFDAEHFFDGYLNNPEYALQVLSAAADAGADRLVLCDTNGGSLPHQVSEIVSTVCDYFETPIGVHLHNDTGCGVANALAGVRSGARQVQGTINGYGERTGNCNLIPIIANLELKLGIQALPEGRLERLTGVAHQVAELVNFAPDPQQPYVGATAFAHKAGLHTSALARRNDAYEHISPEQVGNATRFVVSEMSGRATIALKAEELGIEMEESMLGGVVDALKQLEYAGYHFEVADASMELLMRRLAGWEQPYFRLESFSVGVNHRPGEPPPGGSQAADRVAMVLREATGKMDEDSSVVLDSDATVKLWVGDERIVSHGEGNGPVDALHNALMAAIGDRYPASETIHLTDYKVRVLDTASATKAVTRVLIDSTDGTKTWTTIGVSENIVEASWQALLDSIVWGLLHMENEDASAGSSAASSSAAS